MPLKTSTSKRSLLASSANGKQLFSTLQIAAGQGKQVGSKFSAWSLVVAAAIAPSGAGAGAAAVAATAAWRARAASGPPIPSGSCSRGRTRSSSCFCEAKKTSSSSRRSRSSLCALKAPLCIPPQQQCNQVVPITPLKQCHAPVRLGWSQREDMWFAPATKESERTTQLRPTIIAIQQNLAHSLHKATAKQSLPPTRRFMQSRTSAHPLLTVEAGCATKHTGDQTVYHSYSLHYKCSQPSAGELKRGAYAS